MFDFEIEVNGYPEIKKGSLICLIHINVNSTLKIFHLPILLNVVPAAETNCKMGC